MSFNALSNVARKKNKVEQNSEEYNLYKSGRKGCDLFKFPPNPFFNVGTCELKSKVKYNIRLIYH